jgi:toxin ParE1/3/4
VNRLSYTRRAEADLDSVAVYSLEKWGYEQAQRYLNALIACCEELATNASRGRVHDQRPNYWRTEQGKHVVFFRRSANGDTLIVRVLHQRMLPELHLTLDSEEWSCPQFATMFPAKLRVGGSKPQLDPSVTAMLSSHGSLYCP